MIKILTVEDDENIALLIKDTLCLSNYYCQVCNNGKDALEVILNNSFDLILLDIMLPGMSGFELQDSIKHLDIPIIFITALQDVNDKVRGLRAGADDYIVKPFDPLELLARIEVVLRRSNKGISVLKYEDIVVDIDKRVVTKDDNKVALTHTEFELLAYFIQNVDFAISRKKLLATIWGVDYLGETRTVDIHIQNLRKKLGLQNKLIAIPKTGYRLELQ